MSLGFCCCRKIANSRKLGWSDAAWPKNTKQNKQKTKQQQQTWPILWFILSSLRISSRPQTAPFSLGETWSSNERPLCSCVVLWLLFCFPELPPTLCNNCSWGLHLFSGQRVMCSVLLWEPQRLLRDDPSVLRWAPLSQVLPCQAPCWTWTSLQILQAPSVPRLLNKSEVSITPHPRQNILPWPLITASQLLPPVPASQTLNSYISLRR